MCLTVSPTQTLSSHSWCKPYSYNKGLASESLWHSCSIQSQEILHNPPCYKAFKGVNCTNGLAAFWLGADWEDKKFFHFSNWEMLTDTQKKITVISDKSVRRKLKQSCHRPDQAQRVDRGIALPFCDLSTRRGVWSASRPGHFTPGKDAVPIQETGWAPGPVWTCAKNLAPTGIWSPVQPVARCYTDWTIPAHKSVQRETFRNIVSFLINILLVDNMK
jgi:hypothetical protein